ncbi:MAG: ferredoxin:glutaredoxin reductase [Elusimicrobia bacterium]|nr:ferredoxin:glutaredoxin reductase [Elusimicrobiota bacterium]
MIQQVHVSDQEIEKEYKRLKEDAEKNGYFLNPDIEFTKALVKGLLINEKRYGYQSCPCRLAAKIKEKDLDIICPCYYRDPDVTEFGSCYCGLYVSEEISKGKKKVTSVPERRKMKSDEPSLQDKKDILNCRLSLPVWRCKVCGYLCARENPPEICPICKAKKERFEKFM